MLVQSTVHLEGKSDRTLGQIAILEPMSYHLTTVELLIVFFINLICIHMHLSDIDPITSMVAEY